MNVIDEIHAIVARDGANDPNDSNEWKGNRIQQAISELQGVESLRTLECRWLEYEIEVHVREPIDAEAEILRSIRTLEIAAAPEVAAIIPFEGGAVFVRRYWACPGERLVPADSTTSPFALAARERFRRDMGKLAEHGKIHPYARGLGHVLVSGTSGTLLLNSWSVLQSGTPGERKNFLQSIELLLSRRA